MKLEIIKQRFEEPFNAVLLSKWSSIYGIEYHGLDPVYVFVHNDKMYMIERDIRISYLRIGKNSISRLIDKIVVQNRTHLRQQHHNWGYRVEYVPYRLKHKVPDIKKFIERMDER